LDDSIDDLRLVSLTAFQQVAPGHHLAGASGLRLKHDILMDPFTDFSVSQSNQEDVKRYIAGQEEHHRKMSFQEELRALLRRHEIEWDERFVWD
jgi:hypothetical protein